MYKMFFAAFSMLLVIRETIGVGVGIDWGFEFHKSSFVLPGEYFRAVENTISKRKTQNMMSICGEERYFESQAAVKYSKQNCQTFSMLGTVINNIERPDLAELLRKETPYIQSSNVKVDENGVAFELDNKELLERIKFNRVGVKDIGSNYIRLEEIMAMVLERNLINARNTASTNFTSGTMTIWDSSLPVKTRRLFQSAFSLAGFKLTNFVEENTAAALYDSISRKGNSESPEFYFFVNIGSSGTRMSVIKYHFTKEIGKDKSVYWIPSVTPVKSFVSTEFSGHKIDTCLAEYILKKSEIIGLPPHKHRELLTEVKRIKEILSANTEATLNLNDFAEGRPLKIKVLRKEFEDACSSLFNVLIKQAKILRTYAEDALILVNKGELLGGVVRIPHVQRILKEELGVPIYQRINGDEGMSFGAAMIASNGTAGNKIGKILNFDGPGYGVKLDIRNLTDSEPKKSSTLFMPRTKYGTKKTIDLKSEINDFEITLSENPGNYSISYLVLDIQDKLKKHSSKNIIEKKAHLSFELDGLGIPKLLKAELLLKESRTEPVNSKTDKTEGNNSTSPKKEETKQTIYIIREPLLVTVSSENAPVLDRNLKVFQHSKDFLKAIASREQEKRELSKRRNTIESLAYKLKELTEEPETNVYLSESDIESFLSKANEIEQFVNSDEFPIASAAQLDKLMKDTELVMFAFNTRKREHEERLKVFPKTKEYFKGMKSAIESFRVGNSNIPLEKINELSAKVEEISAWFDDMSLKQENLPLNQNPILYVSSLFEKIEPIERLTKKISAIQSGKQETKSQQSKSEKNNSAQEGNGGKTIENEL